MDNKIKDIVPSLGDETRIVRVHSGAIHIENKTKLVQRKAWFELVYRALPSMASQNEFSIPIKDLKEAIGWDESKNDEKLKELLHQLTSTSVQWNILEKDKKEVWESNALLAGCRIVKGSGICNYAFSPFLQKKLLNPEMYAKIDLIVSHKFKSKYALAIYCLALDYLNIKLNYGEKNLTVNELRKYLGLKDYEYKLTGDLNRRVIKPSEDEINEISDMNISITPILQKKKMIGFKFIMTLQEERVFLYKSKKTLNSLEENQLSIFEQPSNNIEPQKIRQVIAIQDENLRKFFAKYNISFTTDTFQEKLKETQEIFGADKLENYLLFLIKYAEKEYNKGTIKNFAGFFVSLLKDNTQIDNYLFELEEETKKKEQKRKIISMRLEDKLKDKYDFSIKQELIEQIQNNYSKYENIFTDTILNKINKDSAFYEFNFIRRNNGVVTQEILKSPFLAKEIFEFKELFDYIPMSYENWKKSLPQAYFDNLLKELEN